MSISTPNLYGYPSLFRALAPTGDLPSDVRIWGDANEYLLLDADYAGNRSLTSTRGPSVTLTRSGTGATFFDTAGLLQNAGANVPRFNCVFNGTSWISRGLLAERSTVNSALWSQTFSNGVHGITGGTLTPNAGAWIDGSNTADLFVENNPFVEVHYCGRQDCATAVPGVGSSVAVSCFVKTAGRRYVGLEIDNSRAFFGKSVFAVFDLQTGAYVMNNGNAASWGVEPCNNGWYRIWMTATSTAAGNVMAGVWSTTAAGDVNIAGLNGNAFFVDGMQVENGIAPTSYVPTTSATVTRNQDDITLSGASFLQAFNSTEGTVVAEYSYIREFTSGPLRIAESTSGNQSLGLSRSGSNLEFQAFSSTNGGAVASLTAAPATLGNVNKVAFAYRRNDYAASFNGAAVLTDTAGEVPVGMANMYIGNPGSTWMNGHIGRLRVWAQRLPNATLQALSS